MKSTNDLINYVIKDAICSEAIETFKQTSLISEWVSQQRELYYSIVYGPEGLPKLIDCHFEGKRFENIQRFGRLYEMIQSLFAK